MYTVDGRLLCSAKKIEELFKVATMNKLQRDHLRKKHI